MEEPPVLVIQLAVKPAMPGVVLLIVSLEPGLLGRLPTVLNVTLGLNHEPETLPPLFLVVD